MKLTEQKIENGIYEAIRLRLVANGYLPDIVIYINDLPGWEAAILAIKNSGKKIIYVQNAGSYKGREKLRENSIIVDLEDKGPSETGTKSIPEYALNETETRYNKSLTPDGLYDLMFRVSLVCYDNEYMGIMDEILREALGFRGYKNAYDKDAVVIGQFRLHLGNYISIDSNKFMERVVFYNVPSVDLFGNKEAGDVARAEEISIGISTNQDIEKDEEDDIVVTIP